MKKNTFQCLGFVTHPPVLECVGDAEFSVAVQAKLATAKIELLAAGGYSERQAVAVDTITELPADKIPFRVIEYSHIRYFRQRGEKLSTLTAGTLLYVPGRNTLLVHRRGSGSLFGGRLSMFGGHYCIDQADLGYGALLDTLIHEVQQEAGLDLRQLASLANADLPLQAIMSETSTGSIQYTPLCFAISEEDADAALAFRDQDGEGHAFEIDLAEPKAEYFASDAWSDMGYGVLVTWIKNNCPVQPHWNGAAMESTTIEALKAIV